MALVKMFRREMRREVVPETGVYANVEHRHWVGSFSIPKGHELAAKVHKPKGKKGEAGEGVFDLTDTEIAHAKKCGLTVIAS